MKKTWLIGVLLLTGCASVPPGQLSGPGYGPYPTDYQKIIQDYMSRRLKDPMSAQYAYFAGPSHMRRRATLFNGEMNGWGVCVSINAKNSFGGYAGAQDHYFMIRNNSVIDALGEDGDMFDMAAMRIACNKVKATPAPQNGGEFDTPP